MPIKAKIFAGIENDPFLKGFYNLEGTAFIDNITYFEKYIEHLNIIKEPIPSEYLNLVQQMKYLGKIEQCIVDSYTDQQPASDVNALAKSITSDLMSLPKNGALLLPGGWNNQDGTAGHAMVYQLSATKDGFELTAINAGGGHNYHAKKSSREKELFNPTKKWRFPRPKTPQENSELIHFIARLLKACFSTPQDQQNRPYSRKVLYEEIFPSISYIGGVEVDANSTIPEFAFTAGQLRRNML